MYLTHRVATIGGHVVYKIEDTMIYPVSNWAGKPSSADETKYAGHMTVTLLLIDPFLGILVAMVFILEVKPRRPVSQFQASLTKLSALLQVGVQFRYNVEL